MGLCRGRLGGGEAGRRCLLDADARRVGIPYREGGTARRLRFVLADFEPRGEKTKLYGGAGEVERDDKVGQRCRHHLRA